MIDRHDFVRSLILSALDAEHAGFKERLLSTDQTKHFFAGLTTLDLTRMLIQQDGTFPGRPHAAERLLNSPNSVYVREVRAALAVLLLEGRVRNPATGRHPDVWHLVKGPR